MRWSSSAPQPIGNSLKIADPYLKHRLAANREGCNDVLFGCTTLIGFALIRAGRFLFDPLLAIATAIYIAYAGLQLGRENDAHIFGAEALACEDDLCVALIGPDRSRPA